MCPSDALGLTHHSGPWLQPQAASVADQLLWPMRFYCLRPASSVPRGSGFSCHLRTHQRRMKSTRLGRSWIRQWIVEGSSLPERWTWTKGKQEVGGGQGGKCLLFSLSGGPVSGAVTSQEFGEYICRAASLSPWLTALLPVYLASVSFSFTLAAPRLYLPRKASAHNPCLRLRFPGNLD